MQEVIFTISPNAKMEWGQYKISHNFPKRLFDIAFSLFVLLFLSPLYLLIALAIKCSSKGSVFYKSRRLGRGGVLFDCLKFRTMDEMDDADFSRLLSSNPSLAKEWAEFHKLKNDPRITRIGRFLRKTSLDELPQFLNVLKGNLSVVGPRAPHLGNDVRSYEAAIKRLYQGKVEKILSVRPGITGIWQVSGRNELSTKKRCELEAYYAERPSFWQDIKLLCKTIPAVLRAKGAF